VDPTDKLGPVEILVVEHHGIHRDCLSWMLDQHPGMKVVATAATGVEAVNAAMRVKPHVITMELLLPTLSGLDATRRILKAIPATRIIILSTMHTAEYVFRALRAGALGYLTKEATGAELVAAICAVTTGKRYLSAAVDDAYLDELLTKSPPLSPLESLSEREREVMHLTVSGLSSAQTSRVLSLSQKTVDTYRSRLMAKLGVSSLTELVSFAITNGAQALI
jgi:DNA-binding NarL/FixJ family response regulator